MIEYGRDELFDRHATAAQKLGVSVEEYLEMEAAKAAAAEEKRVAAKVHRALANPVDPILVEISLEASLTFCEVPGEGAQPGGRYCAARWKRVYAAGDCTGLKLRLPELLPAFLAV